MFVIRNVFKCKPGKAKNVVEKLKKANDLMKGAGAVMNQRVLVDEVATFWTVMIEVEVEDMASFATALGRSDDVAMWNKRAEIRKGAMNRYLWQADKGLFYDYNFVTKRASDYSFISTFYPLWAGLATPEQASMLEKHLAIFEHEGGLAMSDRESGTQWDLPYGWAPTNWFATAGLERYGFHADAARTAGEFMATVRSNYTSDGTIREKYDVVSGSANVKVAAGYKANVIGFGWTNGVYVSMKSLLNAATPAPRSAGVLRREELEKIVPASAFFRGQTATVQMRNAGGVRFADGTILFAVKVDTSGYSTSVQERYQAYFTTEIGLRFGDHVLPPGSYGVGFVPEGFLVMDLGGHTIFTARSMADSEMRRPTPLQVLTGTTADTYRLYSGRTYIEFSRKEGAD